MTDNSGNGCGDVHDTKLQRPYRYFISGSAAADRIIPLLRPALESKLPWKATPRFAAGVFCKDPVKRPLTTSNVSAEEGEWLVSVHEGSWCHTVTISRYPIIIIIIIIIIIYKWSRQYIDATKPSNSIWSTCLAHLRARLFVAECADKMGAAVATQLLFAPDVWSTDIRR